MQSLVLHPRQTSLSLVLNPATEPIAPIEPIKAESGHTYLQKLLLSKTRKNATALTTMSTTIHDVADGLSRTGDIEELFNPGEY